MSGHRICSDCLRGLVNRDMALTDPDVYRLLQAIWRVEARKGQVLLTLTALALIRSSE